MRLTRRGWVRLGGATGAAGFAGAAGATALLGGCAPQGTPEAAGDRLFVSTPHGLLAVDPVKGTRLTAPPGAIASPDWTRLYSTVMSGGKTRLTTLDAKTGALLAAVEIGGPLVARVASRDRERVALTEETPGRRPGEASWLPVGRERTTLVVADPSGVRPERRLELAGNYEPDAFSTDASHLFVLEYLPALNPDRYRVRQIDLKTGVPGPLLTRFKLAAVVAEEEMKGQGRMQVLAPGASTLFTLYTKQDDHQHMHTRDYVPAGGRGAPDPMVHAFVHTLSLSEGWAYCLDLPMPFGVGPGWAHAIATSRDGARLFVADRSSGTLAVADTQTLELKGRYAVEMDPISVPGEAALEVGSDGRLFVASGASVLVFGSAALAGGGAPQRRWTLPGTVCGLKLSQDGQRLYVGQANRVAILGTSDGREIGRIDVGAVQTISHAGRA